MFGDDINQGSSKDLWTPLIFALAEGLLNVARLLVREGADVALKDSVEWNIIHISIQSEKVNPMDHRAVRCEGCGSQRPDQLWMHAFDGSVRHCFNINKPKLTYTTATNNSLFATPTAHVPPLLPMKVLAGHTGNRLCHQREIERLQSMHKEKVRTRSKPRQSPTANEKPKASQGKGLRCFQRWTSSAASSDCSEARRCSRAPPTSLSLHCYEKEGLKKTRPSPQGIESFWGEKLLADFLMGWTIV